MMEYCVFMHENRIMKPVEIVLRKWGGKMRENDRVSECN
jgi:hypothetical protein